MAWVKNIEQTAQVNNDDMSARIYHDGQWRITIEVNSISSEGIPTILVWDSAIVDTTLTGAQKTALQDSMSTLRNEALVGLGFVDE